MNTLTHLHISQIIQKAVEDKLRIKLNRIGFMYGSIKPDIAASLVKIPHFKDESFDFILDQIKELMSINIAGLNKCTKNFSEKLGIITHYLSDYFCHAHSKEFKGSAIDHYLYESRLFQYYKSNYGLVSAFKLLENVEVTTDYKCLCDYIEELHNLYAKSAISFECDIITTLKICTATSLSIILSCKEHKTGTAA